MNESLAEAQVRTGKGESSTPLPIPWLHGLGKCLSCFAQAASCGNWGDVSNCRVAFAHGVSVTDLPGLHGWHLTAQQPGDPGCVHVQTT